MKTKRKIVLHGPSTLTISLPSLWVKKQGIRKGDELLIEESGKELKIKCEEDRVEKKQLDLQNFAQLGKTLITSSYRQGYDEVELLFKDSNYIKTIQNLVAHDTTGFEIIRQNKNSCTIKDITGHSKDEFDMALRRIWLLTLDLAEETLNAMRNNDVESLDNIKLIDQSINKFSNYCLRTLIKKGHSDFKKTSPYYYFVKSLEEIADQYKDLCYFFVENVKRSSSEFIKLLSEINEGLKQMYEVFYKYEGYKMESIFEITRKSKSNILQSKDKASYSLLSICTAMRNSLSSITQIKL